MSNDREQTDIVFVDAFGTGNGLAIVARALDLGLHAVLLTERAGRFAGDRDHTILSDPSAPLIVVDGVDTCSPHAIASALRRFAGARTGIVAQADRSALATAEACAITGHRFESPAAIMACTDKSVLRRELGVAGVSSVPWAAADDAGQLATAYRTLGAEAGGGVVVKPATGTASLGVRLCWTWADVHAAAQGLLEHGRRVLIERYVAGPLVSIEVFRHDGATIVLGISDRVLSDPPDFGELSWTFPAQVEPATRDAMTAMADAALNAIGFTNGPAHIEAVLTADGPVLIEINPRMPGRGAGRMLSAHSGYDVYELTIAAALGRALPERRQRTSGFSSEWVITAATPHRPEVPEPVLDLARRLPGVESVRLIDPSATANLSYRDRYDVGEVRASGSSAGEAQMRARAAAQVLNAVFTESA